ncbi:MAG: hypothetical protein LBQ14_03340, partial [Treponema sp.]|jgi:hypothetical protein|nr:hypothetical protein [Treponema sp.]
MGRYVSPELIFTTSGAGSGGQTAPGGELDELTRKIALNKSFVVELKNKIKGLRSDKSAAIRLDMIYLPLHYIARFTPLAFY